MNGLATRRRLRRPHPPYPPGVVLPIDRIIAAVCIVLLVVILAEQTFGGAL